MSHGFHVINIIDMFIYSAWNSSLTHVSSRLDTSTEYPTNNSKWTYPKKSSGQNFLSKPSLWDFHISVNNTFNYLVSLAEKLFWIILILPLFKHQAVISKCWQLYIQNMSQIHHMSLSPLCSFRSKPPSYLTWIANCNSLC